MTGMPPPRYAVSQLLGKCADQTGGEWSGLVVAYVEWGHELSLSGFASSEFDFLSPGAQVPLSGADGQTAATQALASAAYRDSPIDALSKADEAQSSVATAKIKLLEPNLGEAFARAVEVRMVSAGRNEVIQSFGVEPQPVVEHCLAANHIRRERDTKLTALMAVFGLLSLPGTLIWLGTFQLRRVISKSAKGSRTGVLGGALLAVVGFLAVVFVVNPPLTGFWSQYLRVVMIAPVLGWFWAKRICEQTAKDLRERWTGLVSGAGVGAKIPGAVPRNPNQTKAEALRQNLVKLSAEQQSNVVFYAGSKGILGVGPRWGSWAVAGKLIPREGVADIRGFRSWDVVKALHGRLRELERGPLHTGGFPKPSIGHWVVVPVGEGADKVTRPTGADVENYTVKDFELQRICNEQQFGKGSRHYLGVQFVGYDGNLVITVFVTVTVLHEILRVEVTAHGLGPVLGLFTSEPDAKEKEVAKSVRFWETRKVKLPLVATDEVVRLSARAPLTWYPPLLEHWGGKITLPEPFGLRHMWAQNFWKNRFMADDAIRAVTPILHVVQSTVERVLKDHDVDTEKFPLGGLLSDFVRNVEPWPADKYDT